MTGKFGIQINPELILKVTDPEKYQRQRTAQLLKKVPRPRGAAGTPGVQIPSETRAPAEFAKPLHQPSSGDALSAPTKPWHFHRHDEDNAALAPYRKVAAECEHAVESLRKQEQKEREEVQRRAKELQSQQYHPPEPKPFPCVIEQKACIMCLNENKDSPLKCQDAIKAYSLCAQQVRQQFVAAGFGTQANT